MATCQICGTKTDGFLQELCASCTSRRTMTEAPYEGADSHAEWKLLYATCFLLWVPAVISLAVNLMGWKGSAFLVIFGFELFAVVLSLFSRSPKIIGRTVLAASPFLLIALLALLALLFNFLVRVS
jgi:hypothetical protein